MKYLLSIIIVLGTGAGYYWLTMVEKMPEPTKNQDETIAESATTTPKIDNSQPEPVSPKPTHKTYQNDDWGIAFEYPSDWEIREPAFGSPASKFNLSLDPISDKKYPNTVLINITSKDWITNALTKLEERGIYTTNSSVAGFEALRLEDQDMGIPTISYLVLINDSYWIDISGKKGYEDQLDQVLESFSITPRTEEFSSPKPTHKTYQNDDWGIAFEYPSDWESLEETFRAASSLFNVIIQPTPNDALPRPVFINVVPVSWGETMIERYYDENDNGRKVNVADIEAFYFESTDMGLPLYTYFIPVNNTYWINISGKKGYEDQLDQVLESISITPVGVELDN